MEVIDMAGEVSTEIKKIADIYEAEVKMLRVFGNDVKDDGISNAMALYRLNKGNKTMYLVETQKGIIAAEDAETAGLLVELYKFAAANLDGAALAALGAEGAAEKGDYKSLLIQADKYFGLFTGEAKMPVGGTEVKGEKKKIVDAVGVTPTRYDTERPVDFESDDAQTALENYRVMFDPAYVAESEEKKEEPDKVSVGDKVEGGDKNEVPVGGTTNVIEDYKPKGRKGKLPWEPF